MRKTSVLMVEDEAEMRDLLRNTLEKVGVESIGEAGDGKKALEACVETHYDIIMLDIGLPDMDGLSVLKAMKRLNKKLFVVLVTADDSIESIQTAISSGANGYVVKPYSYEKILDVINNYIMTNDVGDDAIRDNNAF
ncbi:response regulator [Alkalimarinus alittae]|uniref:Response regulator n=1 Tax=Alkalimarinus alittae TaxID=2961619 RepID=A0ABY6N220_9ALTE|nr:response regulator [Alkalimarinus alittae]UZE96099.1 response regulator [Alkalimarinus alittae]